MSSVGNMRAGEKLAARSSPMLRAFRLTLLGLGYCDDCRRIYRHLGFSNDYCARCEDELYAYRTDLA